MNTYPTTRHYNRPIPPPGNQIVVVNCYVDQNAPYETQGLFFSYRGGEGWDKETRELPFYGTLEWGTPICWNVPQDPHRPGACQCNSSRQV